MTQMTQLTQMTQNQKNFSWSYNNNMGVAWNYAVLTILVDLTILTNLTYLT
jgi:predicted permease